MTQDNEIRVFISHRESICGECGENLGTKAWITLIEDKGALCLSCADLDHLVFLPAGDAALTRRAKKLSTLSAVVLEWSRSRKRYERQGLLVEEEYVNRFAQRIRELFPRCPEGTEQAIAEHACLKYSGRVGRTAAAKALDEEAVRLAVIAHIRHEATSYDDLLAQGFERWEARAAVASEVQAILFQWEFPQANR
jgi:hypothetical protein